MDYRIRRGGEDIGVFWEKVVRSKLERGALLITDLAQQKGGTEWQPLGTLFPDVIAGEAIGHSGSEASVTADTGTPAKPVKPDNNLAAAVATTLCCCVPFGIVAIVYAARVDAKYAAGNYAGASLDASKSRLWMWWGIGLGLAFSVIYVLLLVVAELS